MKSLMTDKKSYKLGGRRGVSMLVALLILLICTFAGAGALTMTATNIGRFAHASGEQQAYYSVTSAATLVRDAIDGAVYTSRAVEYKYLQENKYEPSTPEHVSTETYTLNYGSAVGSINSTSPIFDCGLESAIVYRLDRVLPLKSIPDEWYKMVEAYDTLHLSNVEKPASGSLGAFEHDFTITSSKITIGTIRAKLIITDNYDLLFSFTYGEGGDSSIYAVSLYMEGSVRDLTETDVTTLYPSGGEQIPSGEQRLVSRRVEVTWSAAKSTIQRGEAVTGVTA